MWLILKNCEMCYCLLITRNVRGLFDFHKLDIFCFEQCKEFIFLEKHGHMFVLPRHRPMCTFENDTLHNLLWKYGRFPHDFVEKLRHFFSRIIGKKIWTRHWNSTLIYTVLFRRDARYYWRIQYIWLRYFYVYFCIKNGY